MQTQKRKNGTNDANGINLSSIELDQLLDLYKELSVLYGDNFGWAMTNKLDNAFANLSKDSEFKGDTSARIIHAESFAFIYLALINMLNLMGCDTELKKNVVYANNVIEDHPAIISDKEEAEWFYQETIDVGGVKLPSSEKWPKEAISDLQQICFDFADPFRYPLVCGEDRVVWMSKRLNNLRIKYFQQI